MPNRTIYLSYADGLEVELKQAAQEGRDTADLHARAARALSATDQVERERSASEIMDDVQRRSCGKGALSEPDNLTAIQGLRPEQVALPSAPGGDALFSRAHGAWLGRCAGCLLGKPFADWKRRDITGLLRDIGHYPPRFYIAADVPQVIMKKYGFGQEDDTRAWFDRVKGAPADDSTTYTALALMMLEKRGALTTADVARTWLERLPILAASAAERVAYRNLIMGVTPPHTSRLRNPYREWAGGQARGDAYGYAHPGAPEDAARLAHADAALTHVRNGVYGAMMMAAMTSAAMVTDDILLILSAGLSQIPRDCRMAVAVRSAVGVYESGARWEEAHDQLHEVYDENQAHDARHAVTNMTAVVYALLYGKLNLERTLGLALLAGFDVKRNCASAGSVVGAAVGAGGLPHMWTDALLDTLHTSIAGTGALSIAELAARTARIAQKQSAP